MKAERINELAEQAWKEFAATGAYNTRDFCASVRKAIDQATREEREATVEEIANDYERRAENAIGHHVATFYRNLANELRNREVK